MAQTAKPLNKSDMVKLIAEETGLGKKEVGAVLDSLAGQIKEAVAKGGPGGFTLPGLFKVKTIDKPAVPERTGPHPITKVQTTFKAKPASRAVKILALKQLKDAAND